MEGFHSFDCVDICPHISPCNLSYAACLAGQLQPAANYRSRWRSNRVRVPRNHHTMKPMKTNITALLVALALACPGHIIHAQTNISLNIQLYAGLSVTGEVGRVYQVQYATELSETNTWYALQHFELKWNPHEFVDTTCPAREKRF